MDKQAKLDALAEEIVKEKVCSDLADQAMQLVMGDGNPEADIVFIGEAPGKNEDLQGKPFVGAAGKFLDEMLKSANLQRSDVYITNIVKYRPPNNRDPLPEEKRQFWPFIPGLQISKEHGRPRKVRLHELEFVVIPLYHPAAALYNGGMRQTLIDDFIQAVEFVKNNSGT